MPRVLIAEDDYDIRRLVARLLERDGYEVAAVNDGAKAIDKISSETFDAILLDFMLPVATGADVIDWIETNRPEVAGSCVIIITAAVESVRKYDTSRVYAALAKPFDISELRGVVRKCIEDKKSS